MNEVIQSICTRRSVKKYQSRSVPKELIEEVLRAGTFAPTGRNLQSPIILAVTNRELRDRLSALNAKVMNAPAGFDPFYGAPVVLVVLADKSASTHVYDGSLVMGNLMLAAHALGLGSCWIHRAKEVFESAEGREILSTLGIQGDYEGIGNCILGYTDGTEPPLKPRKEHYVYFAE